MSVFVGAVSNTGISFPGPVEKLELFCIAHMHGNNMQ
jgi:hypothetical protein